jgi:isocitrate/isopropylmalate dehydrogenase
VTSYRIIVIPGDGIGPEIVDAAIAVLRAVEAKDGRFRIDLEYHDAGANAYLATGQNLSPETLAACREADAVLKGPVGLPEVRLPDGTEAGLLGGVLRTGLDTFANVRPIRLLPGIQAPTRFSPGDIDYVIVRENTEGLYVGVEHYIGIRGDPRAAAESVMIVTRFGAERILRYAFEYARSRGRKKVTLAHKANILKYTQGLFLEVAEEVEKEYPDIESDDKIIDATAMQLVLDPYRFDVLVMENMFGDILSDLMAGLVGGLGFAPAANIGADGAMFEAVHGSAPDIAGQGVANPTALLLGHVGIWAVARGRRPGG